MFLGKHNPSLLILSHTQSLHFNLSITLTPTLRRNIQIEDGSRKPK